MPFFIEQIFLNNKQILFFNMFQTHYVLSDISNLLEVGARHGRVDSLFIKQQQQAS